MTCARFSFLLVLLFALTGCHTMVSNHMVGEKPVAIIPEEWSGKWGPDCTGAESMTIEVLDRENGHLRGRTVNEKNVPEEVECWLKAAGDMMFINVKLPGESAYRPYLIKNESGRVIFVWEPDFDRFRSLVERGALPGEIEEDQITLGLLKPEDLALITSEKEGCLFQWKSPMVLIRQSK